MINIINIIVYKIQQTIDTTEHKLCHEHNEKLLIFCKDTDNIICHECEPHHDSYHTHILISDITNDDMMDTNDNTLEGIY